MEPLIEHLKVDHRMYKCHLKGSDVEARSAVMFSAEYYIRWLLLVIVKKGLGFSL